MDKDSRIKFYKHALNLNDALFLPIEHDDAFVAIVYKVLPSDGEAKILKIHRYANHYWRELFFLQYFSQKIPVPNIIQTLSPDETMSGVILMECLPGAVLKPTEITPPLAFEIGDVLARIHFNRLEGYGDMILRKFSSDPRTQFVAKFQSHLVECENHLPKKLIERCKEYLDGHSDSFEDVNGPCIVHRDFRPGNIVALEGKLQGIIDWSGGYAGFAQEDFCLWEHSEVLIDAASKRSFLEGYESILPVPDYTRLMPLLRLHKALGTIGFMKKCSIQSNPALYQYNLRFIQDFFKVTA